MFNECEHCHGQFGVHKGYCPTTKCTSEIWLGDILRCELRTGHEGLHTSDGISWGDQAGAQ